MQHSPQEIKTILDRVVDPDGNVLDMAAVLEVVTILERLPITKEALEKTRLGKTINLLRKKTKNEELARRAKGLVKKWQKLVINHLGTLRNSDSPINGSRVSSPQINGAIRVTETPGALSSERANKSRLLEGKKRGVKRKRDSCSSSENSPVVFLKCDDLPDRPGTPVSNDETSHMQSTCSLPEFRRTGEGETLVSLPKNDPCPSTEMDNDCSLDSGIGSQKDSESLVQGNLSQSSVTKSGYNDPSPGNAASDPCISQNCQKDLTEIRWCLPLDTKPCELAQEASGTVCADNHEIWEFVSLEKEESHASTPKELVLDVNVQADGITGRYDSNGTWHDWTDVMSSRDGALHILPYVILD